MSVAALALIETLRARGVTLELQGEDRLRVRPASAVSPDEVKALRRHKREVLALLTEPAGACIGPFEPCAVCGTGTWKRYAGVALCRACAERRGPMLLAYRDALREVWRLMAAGEHREPWVDTASPVWDLLLVVFAWVAQQERQRIAERVRAGQARARAQGVHVGRKPRSVNQGEIRRRRAAGQGWRRIARAMKTPMTTLRREFEPCQKSPAATTAATPQLAPVADVAEGSATAFNFRHGGTPERRLALISGREPVVTPVAEPVEASVQDTGSKG